MAKTKFNTILSAKVKENREFQKKQTVLKKKHGIKDNKNHVVVVEKSNTFKFTVKTLIGFVRFTAAAILITLAFIGLTALIYPQPRLALVEIIQETILQLQNFIGATK